MKDEQIQKLLSEYVEDSHVSPRLLATARDAKPLASKTWIVATGVLLPMCILLAISLGPSYATARAANRVELALGSVDYVSSESTISDNRGLGNEPFVKHMYAHGMWRVERQVFHPKRITIFRDGRVTVIDEKLKIVTQKPEKIVGTKSRFHLIDFALESLFVNRASLKHSLKVEAHSDFEGKGVYAMWLSDSQNKREVELLIEKGTDLPLLATSKFVHPDFGESRLQTRFQYKPISDTLFELPAGSPRPVDIIAECARLLRRWELKAKSAEGVNVCELTSNKAGDIFMVYKRPASLTVSPTEVHVAGKGPYLQLQESSKVLPVYKKVLTCVATWYPLEPKATQVGTQVSIKFGKNRQLTGTVTEMVNGFEPNFAVPFGLVNGQHEAMRDKGRADWYHAKNDFQNELKWRKREYLHALEWFPLCARQDHLKPLIDCLKSLGRMKEAQETQRELLKQTATNNLTIGPSKP